MVEADVRQDRDLRLVERDRAVAFVDLADEQLRIADEGARERRRRRDEILHHRAVHDGGLAVRRVEDPADHAGHGGLAAGAADGDAALRVVEELGEELRTGQVLEPELAGADDVGHRFLDRRRSDERHARLQARTVLRKQADPERAEVGELVRDAARVERSVRARDLRAGRAHDGGERAACRCRRSRRKRRSIQSSRPALLGWGLFASASARPAGPARPANERGPAWRRCAGRPSAPGRR